MPHDLVTAADGLPARVISNWSLEKLFYVERYMAIFATAMRTHWSLVYCDLLSGPGLCVDRKTRLETAGSPLLAVQRPEFQRLFLNDGAPDIANALRERVRGTGRQGVVVESLDCNAAVVPARRFLLGPGLSRQPLGLAVIDPTGFQISFDAIRQLTAGVRMDLLIVFMRGFMRRFLDRSEFEARMDAFFGVPNWREYAGLRSSGRRVQYHQLLDLYRRQLEAIDYAYFDPRIRMRNSS
jgi:three-Cys-motif partner protein